MLIGFRYLRSKNFGMMQLLLYLRLPSWIVHFTPLHCHEDNVAQSAIKKWNIEEVFGGLGPLIKMNVKGLTVRIEGSKGIVGEGCMGVEGGSICDVKKRRRREWGGGHVESHEEWMHGEGWHTSSIRFVECLANRIHFDDTSQAFTSTSSFLDSSARVPWNNTNYVQIFM